MRRIFILAALSCALTLTFSSSGAPAHTAADPVKCTGYPEPRIFLENQSWWEPQPRDSADPDHPGTGKQGHIHVGTCFPLYQELSGDTLHLDINLKLHNMTGTAYFLRIDAYGDYHYEIPRASWTGDQNRGWHCDTVDCETWVSVDFPLSRLRYGGDHQWNVYLIVSTSGSPQKQFNISRWHASVNKPLPKPPPGSVVDRIRQSANRGTGGDSWFLATSGGNYARAGMLRSDIPWNEGTGALRPISGVWRPRITFEQRRNLVYIDPHLHAVPLHKGLVILEETSDKADTSRQLSIDTRKLANGLHRLVFGTGNVTSSGTHTGVGVIPFLVSNPSGPSPAPPPHGPQPSPPPSSPPHHPPSPPSDDPPPDPVPSPHPHDPPADPPTSEPSPEPPSGGGRDAERPVVKALASVGRTAKRAKLRFILSDDSHEARAFVTVWRKSTRFNTKWIGFRHAGSHETYVLWRVPDAVSGRLKFCVQAFDRAGNWSHQSCARLKVRK